MFRRKKKLTRHRAVHLLGLFLAAGTPYSHAQSAATQPGRSTAYIPAPAAPVPSPLKPADPFIPEFRTTVTLPSPPIDVPANAVVGVDAGTPATTFNLQGGTLDLHAGARLAGTLTLSKDSTLQFTAGDRPPTLGCTLTGPGALAITASEKSNPAATLDVDATNPKFKSPVGISKGTVRLMKPQALGTGVFTIGHDATLAVAARGDFTNAVTLNGGTLSAEESAQVAGPITLAADSSLATATSATFSAPLQDATPDRPHQLRLVTTAPRARLYFPHTTTFAGNVNIDTPGSSVFLLADDALGAGNLFVHAGSQVRMEDISVHNSGQLVLEGGAFFGHNATYRGTVTLAADATLEAGYAGFTLDGPIAQDSHPRRLTLRGGTAPVVLKHPGTFTGGSSIAGTVRLLHRAALGPGTIELAPGGTLQLATREAEGSPLDNPLAGVGTIARAARDTPNVIIVHSESITPSYHHRPGTLLFAGDVRFDPVNKDGPCRGKLIINVTGVGNVAGVDYAQLAVAGSPDDTLERLALSIDLAPNLNPADFSKLHLLVLTCGRPASPTPTGDPHFASVDVLQNQVRCATADVRWVAAGTGGCMEVTNVRSLARPSR